MPVADLVNNEQAMATARNLYLQNCAQCHGSDGGGAKGFPNLANADWQWGGDADTVVATITNGRVAAGMMAWGPVLGEQGVDEVVAYLQQLSGQPHDAALAAAGAGRFQTTGCIACHGVDGKGNPLLGAPNLTDAVWLYGGDAATLKQTVMNGRAGQMPAWGDKLGEQRVKLLAAYVTKLAAGRLQIVWNAAANTRAGCAGHAWDRTWPSSPGRRFSSPAWRRWCVSPSSTRCSSATTTIRRRRSPRA